MRINNRINNSDCDLYIALLKQEVEEVFQYVAMINELKKIIREIKEETKNLRNIFWTEEELERRENASNLFNARMQATVFYTLKNLENYRQKGWSNIKLEGDD